MLLMKKINIQLKILHNKINTETLPNKQLFINLFYYSQKENNYKLNYLDHKICKALGTTYETIGRLFRPY